MQSMKKLFKHFIPFIIAPILLLLLFNSCVATKGQKRRFLAANCQGKDSVRIEYKDKIVKKDTTIYKSIPGPIQYLENPCSFICDSIGRLKPFKPITKKERGSKGTIFPVGNSIAFKCDIDSFAVALSWNEHHTSKEEFSHTESTIKEPCELEHRTKFDGFTYWWFWITAGILTMWLIIKFAKGYLKQYLPFLK